MRKKRQFYLGLNRGVTEVYESDPWFRKFYMAIATLYGVPFSQAVAITKQDRILSAFALVNITLALEQSIEVWHTWWKDDQEVTPELAEEFCRTYYLQTGTHVLPSFHDLLEKTMNKTRKTS